MPASLRTVLSRSGWLPYEVTKSLRSEEEVRAIFMSPLVAKSLVLETSEFKLGQLAGIIAVLNRFVSGAAMVVVTPNLGGRGGDIKCLKGNGHRVFAMRFYDIAPQVRLLGIFPQKDVFLACQIVRREELEKNWSKYIQRVSAQMKAMGKDCPKGLSGGKIDDVLSNWKKEL